MSKLREIEAALLAVDAATFHRLADAYLHRIGYEEINVIGLVLGADKNTIGTPDTFVPRPDGSFVFVEHSTQESGLPEKFAEDIAKCLDPLKTGIPIDRIAEIVLCHNRKMDVADVGALIELGRAVNVRVRVLGLSAIAHDLYANYPGLAHDFLHVKIDTRQLLEPDEFVALYGRTALSTPLDTEFRFRDAPLQQCADQLVERDVVLIAGSAGVGKSRLALEVARRYGAAHGDAQVLCVLNRGVDLFEDLRTRCNGPGHHLLFVDDANRVMRFEYVLELLRDQVPGRTLKIVATVRDYAKATVIASAAAFGAREPIEIGPLSRDDIQTLVREECRILNHAYLERIADVAQGNPRLALMTARVAKEVNSLQRISDVSDVYTQYFRSVREDLDELGDPALLQVVAITAFFRAVDRSHSEMMQAILAVTGQNADDFWRAARRLHQLEVLDMHENEVVRVSDQVLATYLFHVACFETDALDFSRLLTEFLPAQRARLVDALNPVASVFGERLVEPLQRCVSRAKKVFGDRGDVHAMWHLADLFWFLAPAEALLIAREAIDAIERARSGELPAFVSSAEAVPTPSVLSILSRFASGASHDRQSALELLIAYVEKRPLDAPLAVRMLIEAYGIQHDSYQSGFIVPSETVEALAGHAATGSAVAMRLLLAYAAAHVRVEYMRMGSARSASVTIYRFTLPATPELLEVRRLIWTSAFPYHTDPRSGDMVVKLLESYIDSGIADASQEIIAAEQPTITAFITSSLDPASYRHCIFVHNYVAMLRRLDLSFDEGLETRFINPMFQLAELLGSDRVERHDLGWQEYEALRRERVATYAAHLDAPKLRAVLVLAGRLLTDATGHNEWELRNGLGMLLGSVAEASPEMFVEELVRHLQAGNELRITPWGLIQPLVNTCGLGSTYDRLMEVDFAGRGQWLTAWFHVMPDADVSEERLRALESLFRESPRADLPQDLDFLLRFEAAAPGLVARIVRILVERAPNVPMAAHLLSTLFNSHGNSCAKLPELFGSDVTLAREAYFAACSGDHHADWDGAGFNTLLDMDSEFGAKWVQWIHERKALVTAHDDSRDYSFIWRRDDHAAVARTLVESILREGDSSYGFGTHLAAFFRCADNASEIASITTRQDAFLDDFIHEAHGNVAAMQLVFLLITEMSPDRRRARLGTFVELNRDFEAFSALALEPTHWGWSGSEVPLLQRRIEYLESLYPLVGTVALLQHRHLIEERMSGLRARMTQQKKRDFMEG